MNLVYSLMWVIDKREERERGGSGMIPLVAHSDMYNYIDGMHFGNEQTGGEQAPTLGEEVGI